MHSAAHMYIVRVLIVIIVLLLSMQAVSGPFDTELAFVPRHGPSFGNCVKIGGESRISFKLNEGFSVLVASLL